MTASEIRNSFLKFFEERGHKIVPSAPVIPWDDPTLLFTNAGMNQFKDLFLGTGKRDYTRAADTQKCIRVSGKHNDLEEVGKDTYHHTFFEMLGNWSFGDYYKKEAIRWAWQLLTEEWKLPKQRFWATVFETDGEAEDFWKSETDIDHTHILRFGEKDNFWEMGETGPCGPCSEIHIDLTRDGTATADLVNAGTGDLMEIWNLVFIQYNRDGTGKLNPLPAKHVDTGMGFERIVSVLQGKKSNYDTDLFQPIITEIQTLVEATHPSPVVSGDKEKTDMAKRVIADHIRALTFAVADGAVPSNEGRGYVLRRILRRAARFGRNLNMHEPFIYKLVNAVTRVMGEGFPELRDKKAHVERVVRAEEEGFNTTLDRGLEIFEAVVSKIDTRRHKTFPGSDAFRLYDTYGFPIDLTQLMAEERGLKVDIGEFTELMEEQRERAREARKELSVSVKEDVRVSEKLGATPLVESVKGTEFVGYERFEEDTEVQWFERLKGRGLVVLERTPFYVESGGQVDDTGIIQLMEKDAQVIDMDMSDDYRIHVIGNPDEVELLKGQSVRAIVDKPRRLSVITPLHTSFTKRFDAFSALTFISRVHSSHRSDSGLTFLILAKSRQRNCERSKRW